MTEFVTSRELSDDSVETEDLFDVGCERVNDGQWWIEYLLRSPGCGQLLKNKTLGLPSALGIDQYEGEL